MKYAYVVTPVFPVKCGVLVFCILTLTACMGNNEISLLKKPMEDTSEVPVVSHLPVCSSHRDVIICDWGKDQEDFSTKHPVLSEWLPSGIKDKLLKD